ncbi:MAG: class II aldolase/adducin family protein [Pseudomonadota bacterium]
MSDLKSKMANVLGDVSKIPAAPKGMDENEWLARLELAACYRAVEMYGWTSIVYNHITLRVSGTDNFLINPFGLRYDEITASNLIRVDAEGNKISESDWPVNLAGFNIHSAIHQGRKDLHCVIHTHEPISQAICAMEEPFTICSQEGCQFYDRVGYHDFEGIVLDGSEGPRLVDALGEKSHTLVLRNHGLITAGPDCIWAFVRHMHFIRNADIQLRAMASGTLQTIPEDIMIKTREQFEGGAAQAGAKLRHPEWPALVRKIDKLDPSWKT